MLNRRETILGLSSLPLFRKESSDVAKIYGDGINDDSHGIQSLVDGLPVIHDNSIECMKSGETLFFSGGNYIIKKPVIIKGDVNPIILGDPNNIPTFYYDPSQVDYIFYFTGNCGSITIKNISIMQNCSVAKQYKIPRGNYKIHLSGLRPEVDNI
jgi:hypothetical protein